MNNSRNPPLSFFQLMRRLALFAGSVLLAVSHQWGFAAIGFVVLAAMLGSGLPGTFGAISKRLFPLAPGLSKAQRIAVGVGLLILAGITPILLHDRRTGTVAISIVVFAGSIAWLVWTILREGWTGNRRPSR
jgi:hypothetical protein